MNQPIDNQNLLPEAPDDLFVVGIGASVGGLKALEELFENISSGVGIAFIVIQHLSPQFKSVMAELLQRKTELPVYAIEDGMTIKANSIYVIPPGTNIIVKDAKLCFLEQDRSIINCAVDIFFESLALEYGHQAIAVLLSGTGSDGTKGLKAIGEAGGLALIQSPDTAEFSGMPESALLTGLVDEILSPRDLAEAICEIVRISRSIPLPNKITDNIIPTLKLRKILTILARREQIDFSQYKIGTLQRRIYHRCSLNGYPLLDDYIQYLEATPEESKLLTQDLLIGSTRFFRDSEAWHFIEAKILPSLLANMENQQLRVWVAGCATGEEAYTMAILVNEAIAKTNKSFSVKIFATDIDTSALETASKGIYSKNISKDVSAERLERFFIEKEEGFQVKKELREMLIFAPHDLTKNAGFSKINLISCRNVLIYMQPQLQQQVLRILHFSLASQGLLFQGSAEVLGELETHFITINSKWKIYQKQRNSQLPLLPITQQSFNPPILPIRRLQSNQPRWDNLLGEVFNLSFGDRKHTCVAIDANNKLLHTFYNSANLLLFPVGEANFEITSIVPKALQLPLSTALHRAKREKIGVSYTGIKLSVGNTICSINFRISFYLDNMSASEMYVIVFEEEEILPSSRKIQEFEIDRETVSQISELEYELQQTRENLQATIEELETTNEEQQATNEELIASNEELQSTNEELHSVNEELYTVNAEYQSKIKELLELNNDMDNLLQSTDIGVLFLDRKLNIRKFTPAVTQTINLREGDINRPLADLSNNLDYPELVKLLESVLATENTVEKEVKLVTTGSHLLMRIHPYWKNYQEADGLVVTFIDINEMKRVETQLHLITNALPAWISYVDDREYYCFNNKTSENWFGRPATEMNGLHLREVLGEEIYSQIERYVQTALAGESVNFDLELPLSILGGEKKQGGLMETSRWFNVSYIPHLIESGEVKGFFALINDISDRKAAERFKDEFISVVSHELRTPVTSINGALYLLSSNLIDPTSEKGKQLIAIATQNSKRLMNLVKDILTLERLNSDRVCLMKEPVSAQEIILKAIEQVKILADKAKVTISVVEGDFEVQADSDRLIQVLINLLGNAIKFSPPNSTIDLRVELIAEEKEDFFDIEIPSILFEVRDRGRGIPPDKLESIFEPFHQVDASDSRDEEGTGLGLSIARNIVELHGGKIWVISTLYEGSSFYFTIPQ
jgi:two-component system CheB/CheR fusion protein